ncbi:MAG: hypothetical protein DWH79_07275 [Planctomycetota bacterium]|nr:MAG: hypothetical protein DWH79_07275 [Planctomycetota bacterium]
MKSERMMPGKGAVRSESAWGREVAVWLSIVAASSGVIRGEDDAVALPTVAAEATNQQINLEQQMQFMVFQGEANTKKFWHDQRARRLLEVAAVDDVCTLSEEQRAKYRAAATLDGAELMEEVEVFRRRYAGVVADLATTAGQNGWQKFCEDVQTLQPRLQEGSGGRGLMARITGVILDEQQRRAWEREAAARAQFQWQAIVGDCMAQFDTSLGLTSQQYDAISRLLEEKPAWVDLAKLKGNSRHLTPYVFRVALARIDESVLAGICNERQYAAIRKHIESAKGMEFHLKAQKVIRD